MCGEKGAGIRSGWKCCGLRLWIEGWSVSCGGGWFGLSVFGFWF